MAYAIIENGMAREVHGAFTDSNGIQHPASIFQLWDKQSLADVGLVEIVNEVVPAGHSITGSNLVVVDGGVVRQFTTEPIDLDAVRTSMKDGIDAQAEQERRKYITQGAGQAMTYQAKAAEAIRYHETNGQGDYPFLGEEVGITGDTLASVAATVLTMHHEWQIIGGQIERERLQAKKEVDSATTIEQLNNIKPVWP